MTQTRLRTLSSLAVLLLAFPEPFFAFDTPLSDTAVREAYFLGQRHDESTTRFLEKYTKRLPSPNSGPFVSSVTLFTPFAQVVQVSRTYPQGYSAQQAALDHRKQKESMKMIVEILLTDSYGAIIERPTSSRSGTPVGYELRSPEFWKDVQIGIFSHNKKIEPLTSSGRPNYFCSGDGGCDLTGATIEFEYPASAFDPDSATIQIDPPEGEQILLDFDLSRVR